MHFSVSWFFVLIYLASVVRQHKFIEFGLWSNNMYTEQKWKRNTWIVCNVSAKENKFGNIAKMHIQINGLGIPSEQEVNDWNQPRRPEGPSNAIGGQFFMCTF